MKLCILGAGAWGTGLAVRLAAHAEVWLWARNPEHVRAMRKARVNERHLPGVPLPPALHVTDDLPAAAWAADYLISAVPTGGLRSLLRRLREAACLRPLIWLCKGFEAGSMRLPHQVVAEEWPEGLPHAVLSGPSFALEVARGLPVALTLASRDADFAHRAAQDLHAPGLRPYTSTDVVGVEVGGAVKNVIAIAAGVSDGLAFGLNARAALITRGLAEVSRLGVHLGGEPKTFMGLSGMGDLILTCTGDLSRNRQVGLRLARGESLETILRALGHVAEGVTTAREVRRLAAQLRVDMPITETVCRLLDQELSPQQAAGALLSRALKDEWT
ncbi:MAG: NAD(P)-dependent glycerol-3-phosphate dehydrogenase [Thiobacillaceae bacterium]|nr:NAD(P)-dependent glycerol-3-phosphate dehydrogenase [Thiobacillaceae bacterium]MCX7672946.1 NAD(P)-dependent glycerol-3-phosphate dehydrogenase [Thiobacillaceae bacterium]